MSITLELTREEEELLRTAAGETGQSVDAFLKERAFRGLGAAPVSKFVIDDDAIWERLTLAGQAAGQDARARAHAAGHGVVYGKDGAVIEEMQDGSIRVLHPAC